MALDEFSLGPEFFSSNKSKTNNCKWHTWSMIPQETAMGGEDDGKSGDTLKLMLNFVSGGAGISSCCEAPRPAASNCKAPSLPGRASETVSGDGCRDVST